MPKPSKTQQPFEPEDNDIVADMLAAVVQIWPNLEPEKLRQAEAQIRERWGGDRPYIGRRLEHSRSTRNQAIARDFRNGERVPLLCRRYELGERHILRILRAQGAMQPA